MSRPKKNAKPLKVDFLRYHAQDLRERLERGEEAMVGRSRADVEKYIKLLSRVVDAVDQGSPDDAYYAAWTACAWLVNSSVAIPLDKGRRTIRAHDKKAKTRKAKTESNRKDYCRRVKSILHSADCPRWGVTPNMAEIFRTVAEHVGLESGDTIRKAWESYGK